MKRIKTEIAENEFERFKEAYPTVDYESVIKRDLIQKSIDLFHKMPELFSVRDASDIFHSKTIIHKMEMIVMSREDFSELIRIIKSISFNDSIIKNKLYHLLNSDD
jgi:hypothetical protein